MRRVIYVCIQLMQCIKSFGVRPFSVILRVTVHTRTTLTSQPQSKTESNQSGYIYKTHTSKLRLFTAIPHMLHHFERGHTLSLAIYPDAQVTDSGILSIPQRKNYSLQLLPCIINGCPENSSLWITLPA